MAEANLINDTAVAKLKKMAEQIDFAMLATDLGSKPFHAVPMSTKRVDESGHVWFLSGQDSDHNAHIAASGVAQLIYSDPSSMQFLTVYGKAEIVTDRAVLEDLYGSTDDAWFNGVDDPNLSALRIVPTESYYWDPKHNKLVTLFKAGVGAATGEQPELMEHGRLRV